MNASIPKKIGRYAIDRLLGSGAMGHVYLGRDPELERAVAIKTLRDLELDQTALSRFLERFRNEARAAARLQHASIVQVYDVGEDPEAGPYLVFEYVAGATLKQVLESRGPLDAEQVVALADEIAAALALAHERHVIHRDIKPDNLLVAPDGHTKLADFGVARIPNAALTREGTFLGTPCYAAPETLLQGEYGPKSDLFSFAAVLYEAVSGVRAFPGDDAMAVASKVIHEDPAPPSAVAKTARVPASVDREIMRGLAKEAKERHADARTLATAVRNAYVEAGVLEGAPPSGSSPLTPDEPARKSSSLAFLFVMAGGLAVGVGLVIALRSTGQAPGGEASAIAIADAGTKEVDTAPAHTNAAPDLRDAAPEPTFVLGPKAEDAAQAAGPEDAGIAAMTRHEREEAAKDALENARRALQARDFTTARRALDTARRYDPQNSDIRELQAQLR